MIFGLNKQDDLYGETLKNNNCSLHQLVKPNTFRIKILSKDENSIEEVIYDNGFEQEISGGQIVIHTK